MVVDIRTWVNNVVNQPPTDTTSDIIVPLAAPIMSAKAVLTCRPNSYPFNERTLILDQPVKVGRSMARSRPTANNAIFDCKVLSRHHALLWYENGKFYLQDTKSSNGTFVNNNRLSAGGLESIPQEVCSGDIVQFGVDVVENNRKVTHGCIVATLKLYLHDGKEAKASLSLSIGSGITLDELYKLNHYLQDALQREQLLESKLNTLQNLVEQAREATNLSWQAFIGEDRLLSRVEILESQLLSYSKNYSEDKMREELLQLQEDKNNYQNSAKESLRKLHQERLDAIAKLTALQQSLTTSEQEVLVCKEQQAKAQEDLQKLAQRYFTNEQHKAELTNQLMAAEDRECESEQQIQKLLDHAEIQKNTIQDLYKEIEKLQQEKVVLQTLVSELDKCTLNNCPVELKYRVENILKESLMEDIKNTNVTKSEDDVNDDDKLSQKFENDDNHKKNNVPFLDEESSKLKEYRETLDYTEIENVLINLQEELKQLQETEENDNKSQDLDKLREQISQWTARLEEKSSMNMSLKDSTATLCDETLDNSQYMKKDSELNDLKLKLHSAQNELIEKDSQILKMSEEIENLLVTSALVSSKINILENDLLEEKLISENFNKELEKLKCELSLSQESIDKSRTEEKELKGQIECLTQELNKRPTVESFNELTTKCAENEKTIIKLKSKRSSFDNIDNREMNGSITKLEEIDMKRFTELEEELVMMKERYAECNDDKIQLNQTLQSLQKDYNLLANHSHNVMFFYIAPLILLVAYLLYLTIFS